MLSAKATAEKRGLADCVNDLQALVAAQEIRIANLERDLELALRTVDRFADVQPSNKGYS